MNVMADGEQSSTATLGRILSWIGYLWVVFAVLWGVGVVEAIGISGSVASGIGRSIVPAIILIGIGRVMRKRSTVDPNELRPDVSSGSVPTPPVLPGDTPVFSYSPPPAPNSKPPPRPAAPPKPAVEPALEMVASTESRVDQGDGAVPLTKPKTSQELIDEARRRWGTRP